MNYKSSKLFTQFRRFILSAGIILSLTQFAVAQSAVVVDRVLIVTGTNAADSLSIWDSPDLVVAQLLDSNRRVIAQRIERKSDIDAIEVDLRQGNDFVEIDGFEFEGDLSIQTGSGNDLVELADLNLNYLQVTEGPDYSRPLAYSNTKTTLVDSRFEYVLLQSSEATVKDSTIEYFLFVAANTQNLFNIDCWYLLSASDNDGRLTDRDINQILCNQLYVFCINRNNFDFDDTVNLSAISSWVLDISLDSGFDDVIVTGSQIMGTTRIAMGDSADGDYVYLNNLRTQGNVEVQTGNAADSVVVIQCEIESTMSLNSRGGNDYSLLYNTDLNRLNADMGSHNDRIRISSTNISQAQMNGGSGVDTLDIRNRATIGQLIQQGFETILD